ncbi:hypothetical protein PR048_021997 [Dryococelus australis]|uniref:Uncharacterized protein n=1 Tax=Dryococelus australis TaxID=614101 RepID=A0ABQ9GZV4_9NEOP|nr:hypothetical protein PR048_021997 [Dryococelus australis]
MRKHPCVSKTAMAIYAKYILHTNPEIIKETMQSVPPQLLETEHVRVIVCDPAYFQKSATSPVTPHAWAPSPTMPPLSPQPPCLPLPAPVPLLLGQSPCREQPVLPSPLLTLPSVPAAAEAGKRSATCPQL